MTQSDDATLADVLRRLLEDADTAWTMSSNLHLNGTVRLRPSEAAAIDRLVEDSL